MLEEHIRAIIEHGALLAQPPAVRPATFTLLMLQKACGRSSNQDYIARKTSS